MAQAPPGGAIEGFQTELFTGAATTDIPIVLPLGVAGVSPQLSLRYSSQAVDELNPWEQGDWAGLGWTLDAGGFIFRDTKGTTTTSDDTFKLIYAGVSYDLILVDSTQNIYHTKDETFLKLTYVSSADYWTLKTKDGTTHRLGFNPDSKAMTLGQDFTTPIAYKYLLDQVTTVSGVAVQYSYTKQTATVSSTGRSYDQAVYLDTITYAYSGGTLLGPGRQVRFLRQPRSDWTDTSATTSLSFFGNQRLDVIEVSIGGSLVRRYVFGFDYSITRNPNYVWGGGATGDLTLRSVTLYGSDGVSTLPSQTFTYNPAGRLDTVTNGFGGSVSFAYQPFDPGTTSPLYSALLRVFGGGAGCFDYGGTITSGPCGNTSLLGYVSKFNIPGTLPVYSVLRSVGVYIIPGTQIPAVETDWEVSNDSSSNVSPSLLGYVFASAVPVGTVALYSAQLGNTPHGFCDMGISTTPVAGTCSASRLGYMYTAPRQRYRVIARTIRDGLGWSATASFSYSGPAISSDGLEFRGHAMVRASDPSGAYVDTSFQQDDVFKGRPSQADSRDGAGALFRRVMNSWASSTPYPGVTLVTLARTDFYTCDGGATCLQTARSFEYDAYANQTRVYDSGDVAVTGDERDERTDWLVDATNWVHRPSHTTLYNAGGTLIREKWLAYDGLAWGTLGTRGLLTREEARLAGPQGNAGNPVVVHTYDAYGKRLTTTDPRSCTTTTAYEATEVYPASIQNCLGHTSTFVYDAKWGTKLSETDPNGQTTTFAHDVFGRITTVVGPLDTASQYGSASYQYLDWGNPNIQRIRTLRTQQHGTANVHWTEQYFDGLGRIDKTVALGPGGQTIETNVAFESRGMVSARSAPHFATEAIVWTQFAYDAVGRQTRIDHPDGTFATMAYAPGVMTLTDERGNVKRKFTDAYGQLTRGEEVNGNATYATTYVYDATGALTQVTNHLGHVTTSTYDLLGRKTAMQDPNMGLWSYAYDIGGLMLSQTDAKNQTLTFTYDPLGRRLTKQYPSSAQIQWTYDDPAIAFSKGRATQIVDLATSTSFAYDPLGRVTQTARILDGMTYTMTQVYDAQNRVVSQTFPDGETVTNTFNEAGWLATVPGYVTNLAYNARGQRTEMQYANGTSATWAYDPQTFRLSNQTTTGPGATQLQNLSYAYDAIGNITQITDQVHTASRMFTYDALNRLATAAGPFGASSGGLPSQASETYSYDAIGNILTKAGVTYTYSDALHPSAVTSRSDGKSYTYDANGNMVNGAGRSLAWDEDNRLSAVTIQGGNSSTFAYDATGERVRKATSAGVTRYPFPNYEIGPDGVITKRLGFAAKTSAGQLRFYHNDHLGGVNVVTDAAGTAVQLIEYDPWGNVSREEGIGEPSIRFTGQRLDPESGLMYYGGRYYDPVLARFISADPFVLKPGNPQLLNRFSYVVNNPVNAIDPSGYGFFSFLKKLFRASFDPVAHIRLVKDIAPTVVPIAAGIVVGAAVTFATGNPVLGGIAGGAVAGAIGAGFNGGNLGQSILVGAALGGIGGAVGGPLAGALGGELGGAIGSGIIVGGALGAVSAAIYGGNVGQGALFGAVTGGILGGALYYAGNPSYAGNGPAGNGPDIQPVSDELVAVRPFARTLYNLPVPIVDHMGFAMISPSEGLTFSEMGPVAGRIVVYQSHGDYSGLSELTVTAFQEGRIVWGGWSMVSRSALITAQDAYISRYVGTRYVPWAHNSNSYVQSIFRAAGANPYIPFTFAPPGL